MDMIEAFHGRVERRLRERLEDAETSFRAIGNEMTAKGLYTSGPHIRRLLAAFSQEALASTDWVLCEFARLPFNQNIGRVAEQPYIEQQLTLHLGAVMKASPLDKLLGSISSPAVQAVVDSQVEKMFGTLCGEVADFVAGVWSPRAEASSQVAPTIVEHHIHGDVHGVVQQGGSGNVANYQVAIDAASALKSLDLLAAELAAHAAANRQVQEALEDFAAIRSQLARQAPNRTLLHELGRSARAVVEGAIGGMLTPAGQAAATQLWAALGLG